jgi:predicted nucleic acid-binding protein
VVEWISGQRPLDLTLSVLTIGELERAVSMLDDGRRRRALTTWVREELPRQFLGRVLDVDTTTAAAWGALSARASKSGRTLPVVDGLLLATALRHELTVVTRNVSDFEAWGVPVLNPWNPDEGAP